MSKEGWSKTYGILTFIGIVNALITGSAKTGGALVDSVTKEITGTSVPRTIENGVFSTIGSVLNIATNYAKEKSRD